MIVVADASPLIFLGKLGQLGLIARLFPGRVRVPRSVRDEVLAAPVAPAEEQALLAFLASCKIEHVLKPRRYASALSGSDNEALTLAVRRRATLLLSDDRLLRQIAAAEGIRPMGTLGILFRAMEQGVMSRVQVRRGLEELVQQHQFRISVETYDAVLQRIAKARGA
jgi:uncharacterized protein